MKNLKPIKTYTLDELTEKYIGKRGSSKRDKFEYELKLELFGEAIRQARKRRKLTQSQLGKLVGIQKSQISKLENSVTNARFDTIMRIFNALETKIYFKIKYPNQRIKLTEI